MASVAEHAASSPRSRPVRDASRTGRAPRPRPRLALWVIPAASALVAVLALLHGNPNRVGALGLIDAVPVPVFACLALLTLGFTLAIREQPLRPALLAAHVLVLLLLLPGAPSLLEHEPRFATAWLHAGFADYIARTGHTLPSLDARFNWPGFFAAAALLMRGLGIRDPAPVLTWAPLVFDASAAVAVYAIAALTSKDPRVPWLAAWLFVPANWVGQDYFSPQAFAFVLFLAFVVLLLRCFPKRVAAVARGARGAYALLLLLACAIVWSHQLTPYFAIVASGALVLVGASRLRTLPVLLAVIAVAFVSYLAVPYWAGHLDNLLGGIGQVGASVSSNVGDRVSGSAAHEWVARVRIGMTGAVWVLVALGAFVRWRGARTSTALLALFLVPWSAVVLQSYGGEVLLRCYLFALPFAAALMAAALVPARRAASWTSALALPLVSVVLIAGFFVARFGNEAFEMVRPGEVTAVRKLDRLATPGSTLVSIDGNVPWRSTDVARFDYVTVPIGRGSPSRYVGNVRDQIATNPRGGWLVVTKGSLEAARLDQGVPARWLAALRRRLATGQGFQLVYGNADAQLYRPLPARGSGARAG